METKELGAGREFGARQCWYCREPAVSVWHTTWDEEGQDWPMCGTCQSNVRQALAHRAEGCVIEAEALDQERGIDTSGFGGQWIDPTVAALAATTDRTAKDEG